MRIAVCSDIHANLQAWKVALLDMRSMGTDFVICLGDLVGYGPNPVEVVESVCEHANHCVLGNHDAAVCGKISPATFTDTARESIAWTRAQVGRRTLRYLSHLPLTVAAKGFRCAHGEFSQPAYFRYVFESEDAVGSWNTVSESLLFVGHTHLPRISVMGPSGAAHMLEPQDFTIEGGKRYLVNVGSVGNPRDGDPRASYCLYDIEAKSVYWRRIPFDLDAYREALGRAGVSESASPFLRHDPLAGRQARELAGFRPPTAPEKAAHDVVAVETIALLRRRARIWRKLAMAALGLAAVLGAGFAWVWAFRMPHPAIMEQAMAEVDAAGCAPGQNLLPAPAPGESGGVAGWRVSLGDRYRQGCGVVTNDGGEPAFELRSGTARAELGVGSGPIAVLPDMRLAFEALFKSSADFSGAVCVRVFLVRQTQPGAADAFEARGEELVVMVPNMPRQGGWMAAKKTVTLPARSRFVRLEIGGKFTGTVQVKDVSLVRRE